MILVFACAMQRTMCGKEKRTSYVNKMMAIRLIACSDALGSLTRAKVQEHMDMVEIHFAGFIEEHARVMDNTEKKDRADECRTFNQVEGMYHNIRQIFLRRLKRLEHKRLMTVQWNGPNGNHQLNQAGPSGSDADQPSNNSNVRSSTDVNVRCSSDSNVRSSETQIIRSKFTNERDLNLVRARSRSPPQKVKSEVHKIRNDDLRHRLNAPRYTNQKRVVVNPRIVCYNCGGNHPIRKCEQFREMKLIQIMDRLNQLDLCNNCLKQLETDKRHECRDGNCKNCGKRVFHNSIICPRNLENADKL